MENFYGVFVSVIFIIVLSFKFIKEIRIFKRFNIKVKANVLQAIDLDSSQDGSFEILVTYVYLSTEYEALIKFYAFNKPKLGEEIIIKISSPDFSTAKYYGKNDIYFFITMILHFLFVASLIGYVIYSLDFSTR
jgi:hypothetical protein